MRAMSTHRKGCFVWLASCLIATVRASSLRFGRAVPAGATSSPPLPIPQPPSSSTNTSLASFYFTDFPQFTSCEPVTLNWNYSGPSIPWQRLYISIVSAHPSPSQENSNVVVSTDADPSLGRYTWQSVNVPKGSYKLFVDIPAVNLTTSSNEFQVQSGTNSSCLSNSSSALSTSDSKVGPIVGGVVGGVGFILAAAIIYFLYRRNKLNKARPSSVGGAYSNDRKRSRRPHFISAARSWDNLGSVDSHAAADKRLDYQQHHSSAHASFADSLSLPVLEYSRDGLRRSLNGEDEKASPTSSFLSKSPIEQANDPAPYLDAQRRRKPSEASSLAASTVLSHMLGSDPNPPLPTRSHSELPSQGEAPNLNPNPSKPRKRKPVPSYDPSIYPTPSSPDTATLESSPFQAEDPFARPMPAVLRKASASSLDALAGFNHATGSGHYVSRTHSHGGKERELTHKQSFGFEGRPMHYLMPDMPLPQKK